jgi:hypothetical protein
MSTDQPSRELRAGDPRLMSKAELLARVQELTASEEALATMCERLQSFNNGELKPMSKFWHKFSEELPEAGNIVVISNDGSFCDMLECISAGRVINIDTIVENFAEVKDDNLYWAYLPEGYKLWHQT